MKIFNYLSSSLYIFTAWFLAYWIVQYFGAGLSAVEGYSIVSGWWAAAYVASKLAIDLKKIYPLILLYFLLFFLYTISGGTWFYRDASSAPILSVLAIGAMQAGFVASPVFFNNIVDFLTGYIKQKK
ncbi:hypothetical protein J2X32_002601 [Rheinheimera pacifica]|uniref:hypothetical protein n=1 Tax=Rheinheimera pacifica TaxID=173990 RepID=UPI00285F62FB|nr:hypothetical protein [Rheinheimera pacifica]MDR6983959.1 hypothetical protein [Rheinheimera pacifica]